MPPATSPTFAHTRLALIGFTPFERRTLQEFFDLHRAHGPGYETTEDLARAECAVVDADEPQAVARLRGWGTLAARSVLLGRTPLRGAALQLPRPINLMLVMRSLDTLVGAREGIAAPAAEASPARPAGRVAPRLVTLPEVTGAATDTATDATTGATTHGARSAAPPDPAAAERAASADDGEFKAISGTSVAASPRPAAPPPGTRVAPSPAARGAPRQAPPRPATVQARAGTSAEAATEPAAAPRGTQIQRVLDELAFRTATLPADIDLQALADTDERAAAAPAAASPSARASAPARRRPPFAAAGAPARERARAGHGRHAPLPMEHVLVIDHDAATLRLIAVQLQRFGFQIHLAGHPDDAMHALTRRFHDYVFVDPALPGLDALLVCRLARQAPPPDDRCAATVVLLADPAAAPAPLARALPAADGCLKKPLERRALLKLVGEREVARVPYADTARTTTVI